MDARPRLGMPVQYGSCHTGKFAGYAIEKHVPAREIHRLLEERPHAVGLSVPSMPRGAPGMDGPASGNVRDPTTCCWSTTTAARSSIAEAAVESRMSADGGYDIHVS